MKRFYWLLVLPYVVQIHQGQVKKEYRIPAKAPGEYYVSCGEKEKDYCYDYAAALNEAHERRIEQGNHPKVVPSFNYKSACGQDDCGKEP